MASISPARGLLDNAVSEIISYLPTSMAAARVVARAWHSQLVAERISIETLRICLCNLARMRCSASDAEYFEGLGPAQCHITAGDLTSDEWYAGRNLILLQQIGALFDTPDPRIPFGRYSKSLMLKFRKWGRVEEKFIRDESSLDLHLASHARWIHERFEYFSDEAPLRQYVDRFQNEFNTCRWLLRNLLAEYFFIAVFVEAVSPDGAMIDIDALLYEERPSCLRAGGQHVLIKHLPDGPRDNGEFQMACSECGRYV